jgi:hypothetical protein
MYSKCLIFIGINIFFLISCKSEYDAHMDQFKACCEEKKDEKNYEYSNIEEALNAYNFEVARDFLACHPDKDGYGYGKKTTNTYFMDQRPYQSDLNQIVTAEITYFISQGELKKAEVTAKEANLLPLYERIFNESFDKQLDEMLEKREIKKIYTFLSSKRFSIKKQNYSFKSVSDFNSSLDRVLMHYKYEKIGGEEIASIIDLALPILVDGSWSDVFKKEASDKYLK